MGDIEIAVKGSKRLESILEADFGATGKGLHEKVTSIEHQLPLELVRSIKWVAGVRNKVVHEDGAELRNVQGFQDKVDRIALRLASLAPRRANDAKPAGSPVAQLADRAGVNLQALLDSDQRTARGRAGEIRLRLQVHESVRIVLFVVVPIAGIAVCSWLVYTLSQVR